MLDEKFKKQRAKAVRELAEKADPFTKRRVCTENLNTGVMVMKSAQDGA
jgi:hypothetical protein